MTTQTTSRARTADERIQTAVGERPSTDDIFDVRGAIGWTVITFGLYAFYLFYQLMRRSRDHNLRRTALLFAAQELARQRAARSAQTGETEALGPALERVHAEVQSLRAMDDVYRDPTIWLLFSFLGSGLVWLTEAIVLDQDLTRHERHERAAEAELTRVFAALGVFLPPPAEATKQPHSYAGRVLALIGTFGLYSLWWAADLMREGNAHIHQDQAWEDALAAVAAGAASAPDYGRSESS
jgi:hypothetical protein